MIFEIKHRYSGDVLFSLETENLKLCLEAAIKSGANLRFANLRFANLGSANLGFANLRSANLRSANLGSANLSSANLRFADLRSANLGSADLSSADLSFADLSSADLSSADLGFANLRSAKIINGITITQEPIVISGLTWLVTIWDHHMQIGCEFHSHEEWIGFDDAKWIGMGGKEAVKFRRENMEALESLCLAHAAKAKIKEKP